MRRTTSKKHEFLYSSLNFSCSDGLTLCTSLCGMVETFLLISLSVCFFFDKSLKDIRCSPACNKCLLASRLRGLLVFLNPKWGLAREHQCFFRELFAFAFSITIVLIKTFVFWLIKLSTCTEWLIKNIFWSWGDLKISFSYFYFFQYHKATSELADCPELKIHPISVRNATLSSSGECFGLGSYLWLREGYP